MRIASPKLKKIWYPQKTKSRKVLPTWPSKDWPVLRIWRAHKKRPIFRPRLNMQDWIPGYLYMIYKFWSMKWRCSNYYLIPYNSHPPTQFGITTVCIDLPERAKMNSFLTLNILLQVIRCENIEGKIFDDIFRRYNREIRPVR